MSKNQMHPMLRKYFESNRGLSNLFFNEQKNKNKFIQAIANFTNIKEGTITFESCANFANDLLFQSTHPKNHLPMLLIIIWIQISINHKNTNDTPMLLNYAKMLETPNTPNELRAMLVIVQGLYKVNQNEILDQNIFLNKAKDIVDETSKYHQKIIFMQREALAIEGKLCPNTKSKKKQKLTTIDFSDSSNLNMIIRNSFETGQSKILQQSLTKLKSETTVETSLVLEFIYNYECGLCLLSQNKTNFIYKKDHFSSEVILAHFDLLDNQKEKALKKIRKIILENPIGDVGFISYSQLRVECSNKNTHIIAKILAELNSKNDSRYFTDFFRARYFLLIGNKDQAGRHYEKFSEKCKYYNAEKRLELELDLAAELTKSDVRFFENFSSKKHTTNQANTSIEITQISTPTKGLDRIIGTSAAITKTKEQLVKFSSLKKTILILGETGVGKDLIARALHEISPYKDKPFLSINCSAISDTLLQSELFGHKEGAFSGAIKARKGIFEAAKDGVVFLDEIGDMSPSVQIALLRVLENNEVRPVGGSESIPLNCHIIAATNALLETQVKQKIFREDLLYRLKRLEVHIPPLRKRLDDIELLTNYFFNIENISNTQISVKDSLLDVFKKHLWPGNIRELKNEVERILFINPYKISFGAEDIISIAKESTQDIDSDLHDKSMGFHDNQVADVDKDQLELTKLKLSGRGKIRRLERLRKLFKNNPVLTRVEIIRVFEISPKTADTDLKTLISENYIKKVTPSASFRSHYFELNPQQNS